MNEWSPPAGATPQQYTGGKDPDGSVQLADAIAKIRTTLGDLPHHLLEQAGIRVEQDLVRFTGAVDITSTTHIGGTLDVDADATFGGAVAITGTLSLPAGIIDNAALAMPVKYGSSGTSETVFAVTTTGTDRAMGSVVVPAGFTQATILCLVSGATVNSTGGVDYLNVRATIDGSAGASIPWRAVAGGYVAGTATAIRSLTGLSDGQVIPVAAVVYSTVAAWDSSVAAIASADAIVWFTR